MYKRNLSDDEYYQLLEDSIKAQNRIQRPDCHVCGKKLEFHTSIDARTLQLSLNRAKECKCVGCYLQNVRENKRLA